MPKAKSTEKTEKKVKVAAKSEESVKKAEKVAKKTKKVVKIVEPAPVPSAEKQDIITQYAVKDGDTGSPEVQVALLSSRIEKLVLHLKSNPSDNHSRRGLLGIVSKRRRLLHYLEQKAQDRYKELVKKLGLSK